MVIFLLSLVQPAKANDDFFTSLQSVYEVTPSGQTRVQHTITLRNTTPTAVARRFSFQVASVDVKETQILLNKQTIRASQVTTDAHTSIGVEFPQQIVGQDKTQELVIQYLTSDTTTINGRVIEVNTPLLEESSIYDEYGVKIITPASFGLPSRALPQPTASIEENGNIVSSFSPENGEPISVLFGTEQFFSFSISFPLINSSSQPTIVQVALPPDTATQLVNYIELTPQPTALKEDLDGNWIATYQLPATSQQTAVVKGNLKRTLEPAPHSIAAPPTRALTQALPFWETSASEVRSILNNSNSLESSYYTLLSQLRYNPSRTATLENRLGAQQALEQPDQATCLELNDSLIAVARAQGVPARRVIGYAYSNNPVSRPNCWYNQQLHVWTELYDEVQGQWMAVDPTWHVLSGGMQGWYLRDLNHLTLSINGHSSTDPLPAGIDQQPAQFEIAVTSAPPETAPEFDLSLSTHKVLGIPIPGQYVVTIVNKSGVALHQINVRPTITDSRVLLTFSETQTSLLPYQTVELPLLVASSDWFKPLAAPIELTFEHDNISANLTQASQVFAPPGLFIFLQGKYLATLAVSSTSIALIAGSLLVFRRRRQRFIRGQSQKS